MKTLIAFFSVLSVAPCLASQTPIRDQLRALTDSCNQGVVFENSRAVCEAVRATGSGEEEAPATTASAPTRGSSEVPLTNASAQQEEPGFFARLGGMFSGSMLWTAGGAVVGAGAAWAIAGSGLGTLAIGALGGAAAMMLWSSGKKAQAVGVGVGTLAGLALGGPLGALAGAAVGFLAGWWIGDGLGF